MVKVIQDFLAARQSERQDIHNYADLLDVAYGKTFADAFPKVYGLKHHTTGMDNLTIIGWPRMYRPSLDQILRGALDPTPQAAMHDVTSFRYPSRGGFGAYLRRFRQVPPSCAWAGNWWAWTRWPVCSGF